MNEDGEQKRGRFDGYHSGHGDAKFELSPLCGSSIEQDARENPDALFNAKTPFYALQHEKPEHRVVINLRLKGYNNKQISVLTGYSSVHVSNILRQPWAQQRIVAELRNADFEGVREMVHNSAAASVYTLIELRDSGETPAAVRMNAAKTLVEQFLGRPRQSVELSGKVDLNNMSDAQLAAMLPLTNGSETSQPRTEGPQATLSPLSQPALLLLQTSLTIK